MVKIKLADLMADYQSLITPDGYMYIGVWNDPARIWIRIGQTWTRLVITETTLRAALDDLGSTMSALLGFHFDPMEFTWQGCSMMCPIEIEAAALAYTYQGDETAPAVQTFLATGNGLGETSEYMSNGNGAAHRREHWDDYQRQANWRYN